jgi:hypothetical protein
LTPTVHWTERATAVAMAICVARRARTSRARWRTSAAPRGTRFEAIERLREAIHFTKGRYEDTIAEGVRLRHDHGSQLILHALQDELKTIGIESSPTFVCQPEGNGCVE